MKGWWILGVGNRSIIISLCCLKHKTWNHTTARCVWSKTLFIKATPHLRFLKGWWILGVGKRSIIISLRSLKHKTWNHTTGRCVWIKILFIKATPHLRLLKKAKCFFWTRTNNLINNYISGVKALHPVLSER